MFYVHAFLSSVTLQRQIAQVSRAKEQQVTNDWKQQTNKQNKIQSENNSIKNNIVFRRNSYFQKCFEINWNIFSFFYIYHVFFKHVVTKSVINKRYV